MLSLKGLREFDELTAVKHLAHGKCMINVGRYVITSLKSNISLIFKTDQKMFYWYKVIL